jgi:predicted RNA methylase
MLLKKMLLFPLRYKFISNLFIRSLLKLNNFSYQAVSYCSMTIGNGRHLKKNYILYKKWFIERVNENDTVYDIGANNGDLSIDIAKHVKHVYAIEISKKQYKILNENTKLVSNITCLLGDATVYKLETIPSVIILSNVLEHIDNRIPFLRNLLDLYPNSRLLIRVPYKYTSWIVALKEEYKVEWRTDDEHFLEYDNDILSSELNQSGWNVTEPILFNFGEIYCQAIKL